MKATFRLLLLLLCLAAAPAMAQNFSCSTGRPACLGYGDKVVDQNAQCFSGATCGYGGFVCKTKLDSVVNEYDRVVSSYNDLVRKKPHAGRNRAGHLAQERRPDQRLQRLARP